MIESLLIQEYVKAVNIEIKSQSDFVASGRCDSMEAYRKHVGMISGLKSAISVLEKTIKEYKENDYDD